MSDKAVLVDFGLSVQMTEEIYIPRDLRGTEVREERQFERVQKRVACICLHALPGVCVLEAGPCMTHSPDFPRD